MSYFHDVITYNSRQIGKTFGVPKSILNETKGKMKYRVVKENPTNLPIGTELEYDENIEGLLFRGMGNKWYVGDDAIRNSDWFSPVEEEFQEGEWYKPLNGFEDTCLFRACKTERSGNCGYGFNYKGVWVDKYDNSGSNCSYRKATKDEIEAALIAEAKRRGLVKGTRIKTPKGYTHHIKTNNYEYVPAKNPYSNNIQDALLLDGKVIYRQGTFAELVEDEPITINGYEAEFKDGYVQFGCAKINNGLLIDLYRTIDSHRENNGYLGADSREVKSVTIGNGEFSVKNLKQITERIDQ